MKTIDLEMMTIRIVLYKYYVTVRQKAVNKKVQEQYKLANVCFNSQNFIRLFRKNVRSPNQ